MLPLALRIPRRALRARASHPAPRVKSPIDPLASLAASIGQPLAAKNTRGCRHRTPSPPHAARRAVRPAERQTNKKTRPGETKSERKSLHTRQLKKSARHSTQPACMREQAACVHSAMQIPASVQKNSAAKGFERWTSTYLFHSPIFYKYFKPVHR